MGDCAIGGDTLSRTKLGWSFEVVASAKLGVKQRSTASRIMVSPSTLVRYKMLRTSSSPKLRHMKSYLRHFKVKRGFD